MPALRHAALLLRADIFCALYATPSLMLMRHVLIAGLPPPSLPPC